MCVCVGGGAQGEEKALRGRDTYGLWPDLEEIQGSFSGPSLLNVLEVQGGIIGDLYKLNGEQKEQLRGWRLCLRPGVLQPSQYSLTFLDNPG